MGNALKVFVRAAIYYIAEQTSLKLKFFAYLVFLISYFGVLFYSSLGMCKRCGDLRMIACSQCKGVGSVRKGGPFDFGMVYDFFKPPGDGSMPKQLIPCTKCQSKGRMQCPDCSRLPLIHPQSDPES